jgi:hypothetical protein
MRVAVGGGSLSASAGVALEVNSVAEQVVGLRKKGS